MTDWGSAEADPLADLLRAKDEARERYREATFQEPAPRYTVRTELDGRTIALQPVYDPFIVSETVIGTRDLWRALLRGKIRVTVRVDADRRTVAAVMNLNRKESTTDD